MVRRRLTHFPSRRWRTTFGILLTLLIPYLSFVRTFPFALPSSAWTAFDRGTRDSAADSICARATRDGRIYDLPVIFVDQGLPLRIAIYLRIAEAYVSDFRRRATPASDMAQTYNQKRNVYSIDQILGHGKDEGMAKCFPFFFFSRSTRKLFVRMNLKHSRNLYALSRLK